MKKYLFLFSWLILCLIYFYPVFLKKIPVPLDTIVGLYHPWRDHLFNVYPNGIPYKNYLITDPVRQQIPWRYLGIQNLKKGFLSQWNPYSFAGMPLSANIQTGLYYPLNFLFIFLPFIPAWTILIFLTPFLGGIFLYSYLTELKLEKVSCLFGALTFSFSGFFISWLEWGTLVQVLIWLPLILLAKEKILAKFSYKWLIMLCFAETSQLLAGHLQTSFYILVFSSLYLLIRIYQLTKVKASQRFIFSYLKSLAPFLLVGFLTLLIVLIQYLPLFKLINLSARQYDLPDWRDSSWFLPWQHLIQFIVPDFFGNPATLNYWGIWNYGEFISYIGILPLIFSFYSLFYFKNKKIKFYSVSSLIILLLILPNPISKLPYLVNLPLYATAQPTRLISILIFSLSVLAGFGLDMFIKNKSRLEKRKVIIFPLVILILLISLLAFTLLSKNIIDSNFNNIYLITKRNLIVPLIILLGCIILIYLSIRSKRRIIIYLFLLITFTDLFRFGHKYLSFSDSAWFFPQTKVIEFLKNQNEPFRIMVLDRKILPPNFSIMYKLEDVAGYDPVYLLNYAKLVQVWNSNGEVIQPGRFNRIITPDNYQSKITDLLNVKYILSLSDLESNKLVLRLREGETRVYENKNVYPRYFFAEEMRKVSTDREMVDLMNQVDLRKVAFIEDSPSRILGSDINDEIQLLKRSENYQKIKVKTNKENFLVISEINYPSWHAYIDNYPTNIYPVDLALRGVRVSAGEHILELKYNDFN